jgi:hypothetical protein
MQKHHTSFDKRPNTQCWTQRRLRLAVWRSQRGHGLDASNEFFDWRIWIAADFGLAEVTRGLAQLWSVRRLRRQRSCVWGESRYALRVSVKEQVLEAIQPLPDDINFRDVTDESLDIWSFTRDDPSQDLHFTGADSRRAFCFPRMR